MTFFPKDPDTHLTARRLASAAGHLTPRVRERLVRSLQYFKTSQGSVSEGTLEVSGITFTDGEIDYRVRWSGGGWTVAIERPGREGRPPALGRMERRWVATEYRAVHSALGELHKYLRRRAKRRRRSAAAASLARATTRLKALMLKCPYLLGRHLTVVAREDGLFVVLIGAHGGTRELDPPLRWSKFVAGVFPPTKLAIELLAARWHCTAPVIKAVIQAQTTPSFR
jgi:hypothetical protein